MEIRKAERKKAKLRLALMGTSGSGKTYSALQLAFGLGGKIGLIDTEHGSGELYAHLGDNDVIQLESPFTISKYREAIRTFERAGYDCIIIDSLTHAWAGEGGLLDKQGQLENSGKYRNSFATWREITPEHNALIGEILAADSHIIGTMRSKTEYALEQNDKGKQVPRKIGLAPVQRDGMEYEFTVVLDINQESHIAIATKDRTGLFDRNPILISRQTGEMLKVWLETGLEPERATLPELTDRVCAFTSVLNNCVNQKQVDALVANNSKLLLWIKEQNQKSYEELMKEIKRTEDAFELAKDAAE